jgi:general secretion pathway protein A
MHFGLLTGDIGCGKTLTRLVFKKRLFGQNYELVDLENANLPFPFLLLEILQSLGVADSFADRPLDNNALFYLLREFKKVLRQRIHAKGKRLLIMLDEAQQLDQQTLIELKNLTNITLDHQCPVTIILIGQPDLRDLVKTLPQVDQRISLRYHLPPLRPQEIADYVRHRMTVAGNQQQNIFTADTADSLHRITGGVPREINRVCKLALARACTLKSRVVDAAMLESIALDLRRQDGLASP